MSTLAPVLESFFTERLIRQRGASPHTVAAYRDTFRLLLGFAQRRIGKSPSHLDIVDLDARLIGAFLDYLETERHNRVSTRNARLAAVHSFFMYAALREPEHAAVIQRVLALPYKRRQRTLVCFLTRVEIDALLASPDRQRWVGRRDYALLAVAVQTGLRVSELTGLRRADVHLDAGPHLVCSGKGRKERVTPLTPSTARVLRAWMAEKPGDDSDPLFPSNRGQRLSRDAVALLVTRHVTTARTACPSLRTKHVTPHVLRHSSAMQLLEAGVDSAVIALWLGHESIKSTQVYLHADLAMKERALARTAPSATTTRRYRPPDALMAFLEAI